MTIRMTRRSVLRTAATAGAVAAMPRMLLGAARAETAALEVFSPLPPDPAPPGAAKFSDDAFAKWQADNGATVSYEMLAWPQLHDRMATAFASGAAPWDISLHLRLGAGIPVIPGALCRQSAESPGRRSAALELRHHQRSTASATAPSSRCRC